MSDSQMSGSVIAGIKEQRFNGQDHFPLAGTTTNGFDGIYKYMKIPTDGNYIIAVKNGQISFIQAPSGELKLLNNSLQWTGTDECE
jgi:hypothetical protein